MDECKRSCYVPDMPAIPLPARPLRWLYLDLNSYFASVEQQLNPELRGRPVAVGPERIDSGTIIAASYEAKAFGVHTGMRVGEAKRLCPELRFAGGSHDRYVRFHHRIVEEVQRHIPVTQICSIDEVACRLLDNENSPHFAMDLARQIKRAIRSNVGGCLTSSVGIAPSRLLAKIAADMQKPDGLTLIQSHDLPHALHRLSLRDIPGIGPRMEARLTERGIRSVADLLATQAGDAAHAWGSVVGSRMWWALHGVDLPERARQSRSIGHSHVLAPQRRDAETVRLVARRLLMKAAARLRAAGSVTRHLTLHARFESQRNWSATARLAATEDSFLLVEALQPLWNRLCAEIAGDRIRTIGVSLDDIRPAAGTQLGLFEPRQRPTIDIARAMDRINGRFGRNMVTLGPAATGRINSAGARVAFNRIPALSEFA